jgi:hypothetical protein
LGGRYRIHRLRNYDRRGWPGFHLKTAYLDVFNA